MSEKERRKSEKKKKKLDFQDLKYYFKYQKVNIFVSPSFLYSCHKSYLFISKASGYFWQTKK